MRLARIKLAGFKSFVDPTTLVLPGNRVGIVGPNGCGKSNTIDAVRWVMGESSAKHLRGDSSEDVIFNGSSSRKPVGQASIELIFDNSDGRLGGEYSAYGEIAVRRALTRDGQSKYFLNGQRARKRDVVDLFLGTGLGPRSYAIIEQGMIARLIDARPEELRVYLEEAAGISKYKERRRETENRVRHTRENLERLDDVRDEVAKQAERLNRQAATAEKYQTLAAERRQKRAEAILLRLRAQEQELEASRQRLQDAETQLAGTQAEAQKVRTETEQQRQTRVDLEAATTEAQSAYYDRAAEVSRLEQSIRHAEDELARERAELQQLEQRIQTAGDEFAALEQRIVEAERERDQRQQEAETAEAERERLEAAAEQAENEFQAAREAQSEWERALAEPRQNAQLARSRMDHAEHQLARLAQRRERLDAERAALPQTHPGEEAERLQRERDALAERLEELRHEREQQQEQLNQLTEARREARDALHEAEREAREVAGRLAGLEHFAGEDDPAETRERREAWAREQGLDLSRPLVQQLEVDEGWDTAVELALGAWLEAAVLDAPEATRDWPDAALRLVSAEPGADAEIPRDSLAARVRGSAPVGHWLARIHCATELEDARRRMATLAPDESVMTPDGTWMGPGWVAHRTLEGGASGAVARVRLARELREREQALQGQIEQHQATLAERSEAIEAAQAERDRLDAQLREQQGEIDERDRRIQRLHDQARQLEQQQARIDHEAGELEEETARAREQFATAEQERNQALATLETLDADGEALENRLEAARGTQGRARESVREARDAAGRARMAEQEARHRLEREQSEHTRLERQRAEDRERFEKLQQGLAGREGPLEQWRGDLQAAAEQRQQAEERLTRARSDLEACDARLRELATRASELDSRVESQRSTCEELRLDQRERSVQIDQLKAQFQESGFATETLAEGLAEDASVPAWEQAIAELDRKIERLGPINLAAIDEARSLEERSRYLEEQHADLIEALETLEAAMHRIDRETRQLFKQTFDQVNAGLGQKFQRLFGGGEARLEMTGDDLLDTGVTIMARPPGKRLSTIHLMSGGEKALTASALVFAIFELNPAPFCMLDEVDAPLDEANVGRFCELLEDMSEQIQFIFITHNKATMAMAEQLIGVTMHEPGVSRLVSVDIDEAVELAEA
ncbi:chromosome segregation protein SMC [Thioalkalivibrio sp. K90mix]|uniref:chromosome segregation protein SMC n=1 Tax=Thioalkalivibrio sp. (strain K90mix) TaxID=396595 RepID=UPI000195A53E|nr:chromosome segregation protein SMC [Thioalkalivibrio sp. K90mix]ADC72074.1 chromosome segregation protein SMC [Thioalkalivibrio sp. K90mix]